MRIAVTGSTGLIGSALCRSLETDGHDVVRVVRSGAPSGRSVRWDPDAGTIDGVGLEDLDGVVHLAGEGIASRRWTDEHRRRVRESRTRGTALLSEALAALDRRPPVLVSGSAIGYYGDRGDDELTESSPPGEGFLPDLCVAWEAATGLAEQAGIRVVHARTGIVLSPDGGALKAQLPAYRLGVGGKAGSGEQWMPWITLTDEVRALRHLLDNEISGPVNLVGPHPATNAELTRTLGHVLGRPTFMTIPRFAARLPLGVGPLVDSLLFDSARVVPRVLLDAGFTFVHTDLEAALRDLLDRPAA